MSKLYFTRSGADRITRQRTELQDKLKSIQGQKGHAAEVGGNQWHDNAAFEELVRQENTTNAQIVEVNQKIAQMVVVDGPPLETSRLRLGHLVTLNIDGEDKVYLIGGYEDGDPEAKPPVISYLAPLVNRLIGKEEGDNVTITIEGKKKRVEIINISLPPTS